MKPNACHMLEPALRSEAEIYWSIRETLMRWQPLVPADALDIAEAA